MNPAPIPPTLIAAAPDMARRFGVIMAALYALVAHTFLRHPTRVRVILPLCGYINRTIRRFQRLTSRIAAGHLPRPRPIAPPRAIATSRATSRPTPLPTRHGWLAAELGYMARGYGSQLAHLLAEPATAELLATTPSAARLLRPICRMLGLPPIPSLPAAAPAPASPPAMPPAVPPMARSALHPAANLPSPAPAPPSPPRLRLADPPCERLRGRWPWSSNPGLLPA